LETEFEEDRLIQQRKCQGIPEFRLPLILLTGFRQVYSGNWNKKALKKEFENLAVFPEKEHIQSWGSKKV
jgi:hypothetical protein